jgi:hypothetical protein
MKYKRFARDGTYNADKYKQAFGISFDRAGRIGLLNDRSPSEMIMDSIQISRNETS